MGSEAEGVSGCSAIRLMVPAPPWITGGAGPWATHACHSPNGRLRVWRRNLDFPAVGNRPRNRERGVDRVALSSQDSGKIVELLRLRPFSFVFSRRRSSALNAL